MFKFIAPVWIPTTSLLLLSAQLACVGALTTPLGSTEIGFNVGSAAGLPPPAETPVFRRSPIFQAIDGRIGSHAPTIAAFPDGELLAAWYSYVGPGELDGAALYIARRPAGAAAWEPSELLVDRGEADANPVLYAEGERVWLFQAVVPFGWSAARVEWQISEDRGRIWTPARPLAGPLGNNVRYPPVRLASGGLLLPAYDDLLKRSLFYASDSGTQWRLVSTLSSAPGNIQPSVVVLADQSLLAVMRNDGGDWLWAARSFDEGRTWTAPADSGFLNPGSPAELVRLASGNLLLVFNDSRSRRSPLSASLSPDEGETWTPPRVLVEGLGDWAYPSAVQTSDGLVHIVYSHDRAWIGHIEINEAWVLGGLMSER